MKKILSSKEARALISSGAQVLDVRSNKEFLQDAIAGAVNMPLERLSAKISGLDVSKPVLVYCRTGGRSARAQELLLRQGFKSVHNAGSLSNLL